VLPLGNYKIIYSLSNIALVTVPRHQNGSIKQHCDDSYVSPSLCSRFVWDLYCKFSSDFDSEMILKIG